MIKRYEMENIGHHDDLFVMKEDIDGEYVKYADHVAEVRRIILARPLASLSEAVDEGCICNGNWRAIVKEYAPHIGKTYKRGDKTYRFFGLVHGDDDYYYGLVEVGGKVLLSSCVGSLEMNGLESAQSDKEESK